MVVNITKGGLKRDLYQLGLSVEEIAEKHDCHRKTIWLKRRNFGLPRLPILKKIRIDGRKYYRSGGNIVGEHQLVAIANGHDPHNVFKEDNKAHVHHINGCKTDNRPSNIVLLTAKEHGLIEHGDLEVDEENGVLYRTLKYNNAQND